MTREQAQLLQEDFITLSKKHGVKSSTAFFVDTDGKAMMAFNEIRDNDLMHYIANLVVRVARKNNMSIYDVLVSLDTGIEKYIEIN